MIKRFLNLLIITCTVISIVGCNAKNIESNNTEESQAIDQEYEDEDRISIAKAEEQFKERVYNNEPVTYEEIMETWGNLGEDLWNEINNTVDKLNNDYEYSIETIGVNVLDKHIYYGGENCDAMHIGYNIDIITDLSTSKIEELINKKESLNNEQIEQLRNEIGWNEISNKLSGLGGKIYQECSNGDNIILRLYDKSKKYEILIANGDRIDEDSDILSYKSEVSK